MIVVDSSVWIEYFNGIVTPETEWLHESVGKVPVALGDLILAEVLQGFLTDKDYHNAKQHLLNFPIFDLVGKETAIKSAKNYRILRKKGVTVRKTIDVLIGTFCIENKLILLHQDRDFDPIEEYLNLKVLHV